MDQRTRMITVLSCLVLSMTSTAALLAWMDPSVLPPTPPIPSDDLLNLARSTVTESIEIDPQRWRGIRVFGGPPAGMLAGTTDRECHFLVETDGRIGRERSWIWQHTYDPIPANVRVWVAKRPGGRGISVRQWASTRALVQALVESLPLEPSALSLDVDPDLAVAYHEPLGSAVYLAH